MLNSNSRNETQAISELLLLNIRSAILRARLDANELLTIGTALKSGWISPECAVSWLVDIGLVDQAIAEQMVAEEVRS